MLGDVPKCVPNALGMEFVLVPRGTFWMGDRRSQRQVEVSHDFYLSAFPVTQGQWQAVMGSNPSHFSRSGAGAEKVRAFSDVDLRQFPVEQVSWEDVLGREVVGGLREVAGRVADVKVEVTLLWRRSPSPAGVFPLHLGRQAVLEATALLARVEPLEELLHVLPGHLLDGPGALQFGDAAFDLLVESRHSIPTVQVCLLQAFDVIQSSPATDR
jgi:hypothetical protein